MHHLIPFSEPVPVNDMQIRQVALEGITLEDVKRVLEQSIQKSGKGGPGILAIDVNYLHAFDVSDMPYISKLCRLPRYEPKKAIEWHRLLERLYNDQTVLDNFNRPIKAVKVLRSFDKIVNEGLEMIAQCLIGSSTSIFKFHALGQGEDLTQAFPADDELVDEISRIDVTQTTDGGSLSVDGSTVYIVGNHPASLADTTITEAGVFDAALATDDIMLDHTVFAEGIDHVKNEDQQGATLIIYMCGV